MSVCVCACVRACLRVHMRARACLCVPASSFITHPPHLTLPLQLHRRHLRRRRHCHLPLPQQWAAGKVLCCLKLVAAAILRLLHRCTRRTKSNHLPSNLVKPFACGKLVAAAARLHHVAPPVKSTRSSCNCRVSATRVPPHPSSYKTACHRRHYQHHTHYHL